MDRAVLFDFGGTLDADGGHWLDRVYLSYAHVGLGHLDRQAIKEAFYWADRQAEIEKSLRYSQYLEMMQRHFRWQFQRLGLNDPAKESGATAFFVAAADKILRRNRAVLESLHRRGFKLGVISNSYGNIETLCGEYGYNNLVSVFMDSLIEGVSKPDTRLYRLALDRLALPAASVWMVGDNFERDVLPAKSLGMRTAWLIGDQDRVPPDATQVDLVLKTLEELPSRLDDFRPVNA